jgi:hypothetical protein
MAATGIGRYRAIYTLPCGHKRIHMHRIGLVDAPGKPQFEMLDHPSFDMIEAFVAFGAETVQCAETLRNLRTAVDAYAELEGSWTGINWPTQYGPLKLNLEDITSKEAAAKARRAERTVERRITKVLKKGTKHWEGYKGSGTGIMDALAYERDLAAAWRDAAAHIAAAEKAARESSMLAREAYGLLLAGEGTLVMAVGKASSAADRYFWWTDEFGRRETPWSRFADALLEVQLVCGETEDL